MTYFSETHPSKSEVFGAYSPWPRRTPKPRRQMAWVVSSVAVVGVFFHCVLPVVAGA